MLYISSEGFTNIPAARAVPLLNRRFQSKYTLAIKGFRDQVQPTSYKLIIATSCGHIVMSSFNGVGGSAVGLD